MFRLFHSRAMLQTEMNAFKVDMKLMARIRKDREGVPVAKVKQALVEAKNDYQQALVRLDKEALAAGQKKQAKLSTRSAKEGVICLVQRQGVGSVMLEVNCETDFVARTAQFQSLVARVAGTALLLHQQPQPSTHCRLHPVDIPSLLQLPLLPDPRDISSIKNLFRQPNESKGNGGELMKEDFETRTVAEGVTECVGRIGEPIQIRRALLATPASLNSGKTKQMLASNYYAYLHSIVPTAADDNIQQKIMPSLKVQFGRIGGMTVLESDGPFDGAQEDKINEIGNQITQHVIGMHPHSISNGPVESALLHQPFLFDGDISVQEALARVHPLLHVKQVARFQCGEEAAGVQEESGLLSIDVGESLEPETYQPAAAAA